MERGRSILREREWEREEGGEREKYFKGERMRERG